jgi:calcium-dependent protein kinase
VLREIAIMRELDGHPATTRLLGAAESPTAYYLVMELCTGGELFDQIIKRGHFSEASAAALARALLSWVAFAHERHVVHRDLKPENILLSRGGEGGALKVIDYGTSEFCMPGQKLHEKYG